MPPPAKKSASELQTQENEVYKSLRAWYMIPEFSESSATRKMKRCRPSSRRSTDDGELAWPTTARRARGSGAGYGLRAPRVIEGRKRRLRSSSYREPRRSLGHRRDRAGLRGGAREIAHQSSRGGCGPGMISAMSASTPSILGVAARRAFASRRRSAFNFCFSLRPCSRCRFCCDGRID